jgi:hypothetical protein
MMRFNNFLLDFLLECWVINFMAALSVPFRFFFVKEKELHSGRAACNSLH